MAAGVMAVLAVLTVAGAIVGSAVIARHRAQSAADLAALSAATRLASGPQVACASAEALAAASGAAVSSCSVIELDVVVTVAVSIDLGRLGVHTAHAEARAGPAGS